MVVMVDIFNRINILFNTDVLPSSDKNRRIECGKRGEFTAPLGTQKPKRNAFPINRDLLHHASHRERTDGQTGVAGTERFDERNFNESLMIIENGVCTPRAHATGRVMVAITVAAEGFATGANGPNH